MSEEREVERLPLARAIRSHLDLEGHLACAAAFEVARQVGVEPREVGQAVDLMGVRLGRCQLGLFGYGPRPEEYKILRAADAVDPRLAQAVRDGLSAGTLPCRVAWQIAEKLGIPKMKVAAAAEALEVKIVRCQLGAF